jgi:hypothetical protein
MTLNAVFNIPGHVHQAVGTMHPSLVTAPKPSRANQGQQRHLCPSCHSLLRIDRMEVWAPAEGWRAVTRATCDRQFDKNRRCTTRMEIDSMAIPGRPDPVLPTGGSPAYVLDGRPQNAAGGHV